MLIRIGMHLQACTSLQVLKLGDAAGFCHADMRACPVVRPSDVVAFKAHMPFLHTLVLGGNQVLDPALLCILESEL